LSDKNLKIRKRDGWKDSVDTEGFGGIAALRRNARLEVDVIRYTVHRAACGVRRAACGVRAALKNTSPDLATV
jgi:hypothetical protein